MSADKRRLHAVVIPQVPKLLKSQSEHTSNLPDIKQLKAMKLMRQTMEPASGSAYKLRNMTTRAGSMKKILGPSLHSSQISMN